MKKKRKRRAIPRNNSPYMEKKIQELYHRIGLKYGYCDEDIEDMIRSQYQYIRKTMVSMDIKGVQSQEEFDKLGTNFVIKSIGKLHTSWKRIMNIRKQVALRRQQNINNNK